MPARLTSTVQDIFLRLARCLRLPSCCALCNMAARPADGVLCDGCRQQFLQIGVPRCASCAIRLTVLPDALCGACLHQQPAFDATIAAVDYRAPLDQLLLGLKFSGQLAFAPLFAELLRDALLDHSRLDGQTLPLPEVLLAVPLGEHRLIERGFNQALEIARGLSRHLGLPLLAHLPLRERETLAQSGLPMTQRHRNIAGAFVMPAGAAALLNGRHVGVVDDVMTTGATLDAMATVLKRHGAVRVTNLVFARTPVGRMV